MMLQHVSYWPALLFLALPSNITTSQEWVGERVSGNFFPPLSRNCSTGPFCSSEEILTKKGCHSVLEQKFWKCTERALKWNFLANALFCLLDVFIWLQWPCFTVLMLNSLPLACFPQWPNGTNPLYHRISTALRFMNITNMRQCGGDAGEGKALKWDEMVHNGLKILKYCYCLRICYGVEVD